MHIVIRKVSGQRMVVDLEELEELTICEVKQLIELEWSDLTSDEMVLIFKGKILKDDDVVNELGIKDGATCILTKKKHKKKATPKPVAPTPPPAAPANPHLPPGMQQMMQNPLMQQMMDNMMSDPNFMEMLLANNPQMQEVMQQNPELRHALRDPDTIRQAMQMIRDPNAMQQALQNQDRAIANISNMPGGFNALSRMYNQVQAPMEDAMSMRDPDVETRISEVDTSTGPTSSAMPNPFAQSNTPSRPSQPRSGATNLNPINPFNLGNQNNPNLPFSFGPSPQQNNQQNQNQNAFPGGFPMFPMFAPMQQPPAPQQPERFAAQMSYLRSQGYTNDEENRQALLETEGNLELAIAILLANRDD